MTQSQVKGLLHSVNILQIMAQLHLGGALGDTGTGGAFFHYEE